MQSVTSSVWAKVVAVAAAVFVVMALVLFALNSSSLPNRFGGVVAGAFTRATGWDVTVGSVEFAGPTRLVLHDVTFVIPDDAVGAEWIRGGESPAVNVGFNPLRFVFPNAGGSPFGKMTWVRPQVHLVREFAGLWPFAGDGTGVSPSLVSGDGHREAPTRPRSAIEVEVVDGRLHEPSSPSGASPATAGTPRPGVWNVDGLFSVDTGGKGALDIARMKVSEPDAHLAFEMRTEGAGDARHWTWHAEGPADVVTQPLLGSDWGITGALRASGTQPNSAAEVGTFSISVQNGDVRWGNGSLESVPFDELHIRGSLNQGVAIDELRLTQGTGVIRAAGRLAAASGGFAGTELALDVSSAGLLLPESIPVLARFGLSGTADFAGVLSGTIATPELSGRLTIDSGTVWHRAVDRGEGVILLTPGRFTFGQVRLDEGNAHYRLKGEWLSHVSPNRFTIELESENGRVEEILATLGIESDMEQSGNVNGRFTFTGESGSVHADGSFVATDLVLANQRLDSLSGRIARTPDSLRLDGIRAGLGTGTAHVRGEVRGETLGIDVTLEHWPLDLGALVAGGAVGEAVSGWVSYDARVSGTLESPSVTGTVRDGIVSIGQIELLRPSGGLGLDLEHMTLENMRVSGVGGGTYRVNGRVDSWTRANPALDLDVAVQGASLSALLNETGLSWPALLFDGNVDGSIGVSGEAAQPDARFDLALSDEFNVNAPIRLRFNLQDGRLRLGGIPLPGLGAS